MTSFSGIGLVALLLLVLPMSSLRGGEEPDPPKFPFYTEALAIGEEEKAVLAQQLVALAVNHPAMSERRPDLAFKALSLAMALAPALPDSGRATRLIAEGGAPESMGNGGAVGVRPILLDLWKHASEMHARPVGKDELAFSYYLMDVVSSSVPAEDVRFARLRQLVDKAPRALFPGWSEILPEVTAEAVEEDADLPPKRLRRATPGPGSGDPDVVGPEDEFFTRPDRGTEMVPGKKGAKAFPSDPSAGRLE